MTTTTVAPAEEETTISTTSTNDTSPFGTLFSNLFLQFFTNDNSTSSDVGDNENSESLLMDILNSLFADEASNETDESGISSFLKQVYYSASFGGDEKVVKCGVLVRFL